RLNTCDTVAALVDLARSNRAVLVPLIAEALCNAEIDFRDCAFPSEVIVSATGLLLCGAMIVGNAPSASLGKPSALASAPAAASFLNARERLVVGGADAAT